MKKLLVFALLAALAVPAFAATGWYSDYVLVSSNGGSDGYYWIGGDPGFGTSFAGATFNVTYGQALEFGADMKYWSDNQDRTGGAFYWRIDSGTFNEVLWAQSYLGGNDYQGLESTENNVASGLNAGTYTVSVYAKNWGSSQGDSYLSNGGANYVANLVIAKAAAAVYLGDLSQIYDGTAKTASATTLPAGLTVSFTYDGSATAPTAAGSYAVTGTISSANYEGAANGTLVISKAGQTIDFPAIGNQLTTNEVDLSATASSGLDVGFAVASGPADIEGTTLTFTGEGTVSIVASQAGDDNWNAAPDVTNTFDVTEPDLAVVLSRSSVNVREAGEGRFFVRLNKDPGADVAVGVARSAGSESLAVLSGAALEFKPSNWSVWQTVTLSAPEDDDAASETATFAVSLEGAADVLAEAATLDDEIGDNLALASAGATMTAWRGYRTSQAIDGVHAVSTNYAFTTWTSVPPGTITLDLQATTAVSRVRILTWDWNYRSHRYTVESSLDGSSWSTLVDASAGDHLGWEDWAIGDQQMRYLRFTGLTNSVNAGVCVPEWEVYGERLQPASLEFSATAVNVREEGEGRLFVRMTSAPEGNVVVNAALEAGDADVSLQGATALTFKPSNWSTWQAVTVAAGADADAVNETASVRISTVGVVDQTVDVLVLDDDIGENLALASGGATVSGVRGYRTADLIDGVHAVSTNYAFTTFTSVPPGTLTLDLQTAMTVSRVRVLTWDWNYRNHQYVVEGSADGSSWSTLADASAGAHRGWEDWAVADAQIRYVRFTGLTNSVNAGVCVPELEVYGTRPLPELIQLSKTSVNVREGGEGRLFVRLASAPAANVAVSVARASGDESLSVQSGASLTFKPSNWSTWQRVTLAQGSDEDADGETAVFEVSTPGVLPRTVSVAALDDDIDENLALASAGATLTGRKAYYMGYVNDGAHTVGTQYGYTIWTNDPPGTMTLDLQSAATVSRVRILNWDWTYRAHQYLIESSADGETWTTLADASVGAHHGWEDWAVADESIRYLRFTGLSNSANTSVCISELEVYGTRAPARRSLAPAKGGTVVAESEPISVLTSDGPEDETGWNAVDGDDATAWIGQKAGGGYVVVEYAPALQLSGLEVDLAAGSLTGVEYLYSADGAEWQPLPEDLEAHPVSLNFLWLVFPDDGTEAVPHAIEIRPNP